MTNEPESFGDKLARFTRVVLIGAVVVVAVLLITNPPQSANPFSIGRAQADGLCASPGYLVLTANLGGASKFYIIDANKQVICVYDMVGDKLRLVSARKFDFDSDIFDGSLQVGAVRGIEGGNGITRGEAKMYSEGLKKMWEEATKKKP